MTHCAAAVEVEFCVTTPLYGLIPAHLLLVERGTLMRFLVVVRPNFRRDELATGDYTFALVTAFVTGRRMRHGFYSLTAHTLCGMCGLARVSSHVPCPPVN